MKKNKNIIDDNQLQSYTVTTFGTDRKKPDIFKEACNRFLTDSLENILLVVEKQNI